MSLLKPDAYDRVIEKLGLSFNPGSPDDPPYPEPEFFLKYKPRDFCPWCDNVLFDGGESPVVTTCLHCFDYDDEQSIDENRIRYAAEILEDMQNDRT